MLIYKKLGQQFVNTGKTRSSKESVDLCHRLQVPEVLIPPPSDGENQGEERVTKSHKSGYEKSGTEIIVPLPNGVGEIHYYPRSQSMCATCRLHAGDCRRFRGTKRGPRSEGRPLGLLVAWLLQGNSHGSKVEHCLSSSMAGITRAERISARNMFKGLQGANAILAGEAPALAGEEEPYS